MNRSHLVVAQNMQISVDGRHIDISYQINCDIEGQDWSDATIPPEIESNILSVVMNEITSFAESRKYKIGVTKGDCNDEKSNT